MIDFNWTSLILKFLFKCFNNILKLTKKKICSLLRGGIAERGGVRVGHRIIEINGQSVVATTHEKIVSILANSVGEVIIKISDIIRGYFPKQ